MLACLHRESTFLYKIPDGRVQAYVKLGKGARLELEWNAAVEIFRGDLLEWGRRYYHDGIERKAAGDTGLELGTDVDG